MHQERIIVSITSYSKRIVNIPPVLDTIFSQTLPPDLVVLNLALEEIVPADVQKYIDIHKIEINRVQDTKVYKKLIPTLLKYPDDCIISIDDDFLYPSGMIEDFIKIHRIFPDFPISGNNVVLWGFQCHCGCASLMKLSYLGNYIKNIDGEVMRYCLSDDLVYTYFANKNGHPYMRTSGLYFLNMPSYNEGDSYTEGTNRGESLIDSYNYLVNRFGKLDNNIKYYLKGKEMDGLVTDIMKSYKRMGVKDGCESVCSSYSYRIGELMLRPLKLIRLIWK